MKVFYIPSNPKALLFDIDSTLYTNNDYAFEQVDVQIRYFAKLKQILEDEARNLINNYRNKWAQEHDGKKTSLGNTLKEFGIPIEESIRWREMLIDPYKFLTKDVKLQETLKVLSSQFVLTAVTNNPVLPAKKTLDALGISELIPVVIGLDTCNVSKPSKIPYELGAEKSGCKNEECISIGDRYDIDLLVPMQIGMGAVLVSGVEDVYKLPEILIKP